MKSASQIRSWRGAEVRRSRGAAVILGDDARGGSGRRFRRMTSDAGHEGRLPAPQRNFDRPARSMTRSAEEDRGAAVVEGEVVVRSECLLEGGRGRGDVVGGRDRGQ